jgi:photosystem II stability/assembly factor-like uncharacterized protein
MLGKDLQRVKISQVIDSQLSNFILGENELFREFLKQYYISQNQVVELSENIDQYVNLENFDASKFTEYSTTLNSDITYYDDVIDVESTISWPDSYGLLKIDDEIITYTSKDATHFYGCIRGFSGIESYNDQFQPNELVFSETESAAHTSGKEVKNISNIVYVELWKRIKAQFLPGFEDRKLDANLDKKLFLKQSKDFYESKGTLEAFKILFKAIYGDPNVKVINPSEYVIRPSSAQWSLTNNLIVEPIIGDIAKINGQPIIQNNPYAYGNVYISTLISNEDKVYYEIVLSNDTKIGSFKATPITKTIIGSTPDESTIYVDSTIGFPNSGQLRINNDYITYDGKNDNQFFNCTITNSIDRFVDVYLNDFVYSYEEGDIDRPVLMRVTSVISDTTNILDTAKYLKVGDEIGFKNLGEDTDPDKEIYNKRIDNWLHNNIYEVKVVEKPFGITKTSSPARINTKAPHGLKLEDKVTLYDVDDYDNSFNPPVTGTVVQIFSPTSFALQYSSGTLDSNLNYRLFRDIKITTINNSKFISDVQNTYVNRDRDYVYVTATGLPSYNVPQSVGEVYFSIGQFETEIITTRSITNSIINHNFNTGDKVYYSYSGANVGITTGLYFVKKISATEIKLAYNRAKIFQNDFITFTPSGSPTEITNTLVLSDLAQKEILDQKLLKRIAVNPKQKSTNYSLDKVPTLNTTGILLNGQEILYPKSNDKIYYGKIQSIDVLGSGSGYDIINPPNVIVEDVIGYGASAFAHIEGGLSKVILLDSGFDYLMPPTITIEGGNGSGATAEPIMRDVFTSINFDGASPGINTTTNEIGFSTFHNFKTGEEVIYRSYSNLSIGIGSDGTPAAGNPDTTAFLIDLSKYYVIKVNDNNIKLTTSEANALAGINTINLTQLGRGNHTLVSTKSRKIIDRIEVTNSGSGYVNKKVQIISQTYPPRQPQNIPIALVGINTQENYIYAKNHNFVEKEIVYYDTTGSSISGLSTNNAYYVNVLDNDKFRLISAGIRTSLTSQNYDQQKYVKFESFGSGEHTISTPPISLKVLGIPNSTDVSGEVTIGGKQENSQAVATPIFTGSITNIFIKDGGNNYGTPEILNYNRKPNILLSSGKDALLQPIIINGGITEVYILSQGNGYVSVPDITVSGDGRFASLRPVIRDGKIIDVEVIDSGSGYRKENTILTVVPRGRNATFSPNLQVWHVNEYKKYESIINNPSNISNSFYVGSMNKSIDSAQLVSAIVPKKLRYLLGDNLDGNLNTTLNIKHSPIVGWAYDGIPIYGPFGSSNTSSLINIKELKSGYEILPVDERPDYPEGFFIEDYVYTANGDLDQNNGRYCITPEFPNGTYAYFSTGTNYPYVLNDYAYEVDVFNTSFKNTQLSNLIETEELVRNTSPYRLNREYFNYDGINTNYAETAKILVRSVTKSGVDSIQILNRGNSYKIGDRLTFNNSGTNGRGLSAKVDSIVGVAISSVENISSNFNNIEFIQQDNQIIGIFTSPHSLVDRQLVNIIGINTTSYKFIEGRYFVGVSSFYSNLKISIGSSIQTGIATEIILSESPNSNKIISGDVITIDDEKLLILGKNKLNTAYKVLRAYESTVGSAHSATTEVVVNSRNFSIPVQSGIKTESNTTLNRSVFFNPQLDLGIGNSITTVQIGIGKTAQTIGVQTGQGSFTKFEFYSNPFNVGDVIQTENILNLGITSALVVQRDPGFILVNYNSTSNTNVSVSSTSIIKQIQRISIPQGSIYLPNHRFRSGQKVTYSTVNGIGITCSTSSTLTPTFNLQSDSNLYIIVDNSDFVGVSTTLLGATNGQGRLYFPFKDVVNGSVHKLETTFNNPKGNIILNEGVVTTFQNHELKYDDFITLNVLPNQTENVSLKFDNSSARLLVNPVGFGSTNISISENEITIIDHKFKTGDKVVYNANSPALPLQNGEEYFVIKIDQNRIKLAEFIYDAKNIFYSGINITTAGIGSQTLSPINPPLKFTLGNVVSFDVSDVSLSSLILDFYVDNSFTNKINLKNITRNGVPGDGKVTTRVNLKLDTNIPSQFYYKLNPVGISTITTNAYAYNVDKDVDAYSQINVLASKYNGFYRITSVGSTTFKFDMLEQPETIIYTNSGVTTFSYITDSATAIGGIENVSIGFTGTGYTSLPEITNIVSQSGNNGSVKPFSFDIGKIKNTLIVNSGYNFPTDPSLKPKADIPFTLKLKDNYQIKDIIILDSGKNYLVEPKLLCLEHPEIVFDVELESNSVSSAKISINKTGLKDIAPTIIPINNSNGVQIIDAFSDGQTNTLKISSNNGKFIEFPFTVGDKIFVEGIEVSEPLNGNGGYNSENYNFKYFEVSSIDTTTGNESVSYSIVGLGSTGGYFDPNNSVGRVIKYDDLAKFTCTLEKTDFIENEIIFSNGSRFKVYRNGWDSEKDILKIVGNSFNISVGSSIVGTKSNSRATVEEVEYSDAHFNCSGEYLKENGWKTKTGFTNENDQRIQDSQYYQNFSYAINSPIVRTDWVDSVKSLAHPSGFEVFGDVVIASKPTVGVGRSSNLKVRVNDVSDTIINLVQEISFNTKQYFDTSYEITTNKGISKDVGFLTKKLFDYSICRTNKVLSIDDISDEFNGTSVLELNGINADGADLLILNKDFIESEVVGFITNTYPSILTNPDFDATICKRDVGLVVESIGYDLKYGGNERSVAAGLAYWSGVGGTSFVEGESQETIAGFRYIIDLSRYIINNVAITTSYQSTPFAISQQFNFNILIDSDCSPAYNENCCAPVVSAIGSYVGIITSIIGIGTTAAPNVNKSTVSKGGTIVGLSSFIINNKNRRLLSNSFNPNIVCSVGSSILNIPNHGFSTGEELIYDVGLNGTPIAINSTNRVIGGISTDFMPTNVFAYRVDQNRLKIVGLKTDAVATGNFFTFRNLGGGLVVGSGTTHTLHIPYDNANTRALITIDNIIQSPLRKDLVDTSLANPVSVGATIVTLTGITSITARNILRIDDELMKINSVGFGSTNIISVDRGYMGTIAIAHTIGAGVTVLSGDYNINNGIIYFTTPPYGNVGPVGISTRSSFNGRIFYRLNYDSNYVFDDISNDFNGNKKSFELTSYGKNVTGIITNLENNTLGPNYGIVSINNVLQSPVLDYSMTERFPIAIGGSIAFTGSSVLDLPKGGVIDNVNIGFGSGYQALVPAFAIPVVSGSGTIQALVLTSSGSGYRSNVDVKINSSVGFGASIVALVGTGSSVGIITGFNIVSGGIGYTSSDLPIAYVGIPTAYSSIPLIGGSGTGAKINVIVGSGGSVTQFEFTDRGIGYKVNDVLTISNVPTQVGVATSAFTLTVLNTISDKFTGFHFGNLTLLDDISSQFNGVSRSFNLTKTDVITEKYSINAVPGSGIDVSDNLLVVLNGILQHPRENYNLIAGERLVFTSPPAAGSDCLIFFYRGSNADVIDVNVLPEVKAGDSLRLLRKPPFVEQLQRIVTNINSISEVKTTNYIDVGISTNPTFYRTVSLDKQKSDLVIDNVYISKARALLEGKFIPVSRIIKEVKPGDFEVYVDNAYPAFTEIDNLLETRNSIIIFNEKETKTAKITAVVSAAGTITDFNIVDSGFGYSDIPEISVSTTANLIPQFGKNWNLGQINLSSQQYNDFDFGNGLYVACSNVGGLSFSVNFVNWSPASISTTNDLNGIAFGNNGWVVVGSGATTFSSSDGLSWSSNGTFLSRVFAGGIIPFEYPPANFTGDINSVVHGMDKFIAVGSGGTALVSEVSTGISTSWIVRRANTNNLNSVAFGIDNYVAVGDNGSVSRSPDGYVWTNSNSGTNNNLTSIKFLNGNYFVVGESGTILNSSDGGGSWNNVSQPEFSLFNLYDITYKNEVYLITGSSGLTLVSIDGNNWVRTTDSGMDINKLGTNEFNVIGVGQSSQYAITDSTVVKATVVANISIGGTVDGITVTEPGFGYDTNTPVIVLTSPATTYYEQFDNIKVQGDYGDIVSIKTNATGISTTTPMIIFEFDSDKVLNQPDFNNIVRSGISTGDYFVINNSVVGNGIITLDSQDNFNTLSIGSSFIDNVYRADNVQLSSSGIVTVFSNVSSISGIGTTSGFTCAKYSWSKIYDYNSRQDPRSFTLSNNGLAGVSTAPLVFRKVPLSVNY